MFLRKKYIDKILSYLKLVDSVFLVGARQVGKTTILKSLVEFDFLPRDKTFYVNFDEFLVNGNTIFNSMQDFIAYLELNYQIDFEKMDYFLFDEVKNLKNFNILLKSLIDSYPDKKFICTSSGNYVWLNEIVEGLAGRSLQLIVYPLDFEEFLQFKQVKYYETKSEIIFKSLEKYFLEYISFGGYPKVVLSDVKDKKLVLKSILDSVVLKDLKEFLKQDQIVDLVKLVKYVSSGVGSKFSYEKLANELGLKVNYVKKYLYLLEQIFFVNFLKPFYTDKKKEISNKRKLYFLDFGLMNYYLDNFVYKSVYTGKDVEMFVFLQLLFNLNDFDNLYFYQTLNETEIDFIYKTSGGIIPIEVKSSNKNNIPKIFKFFCEKYFDQIRFMVKTNKWGFGERKEDCLIKFIPFLNMDKLCKNE